MLQSTYYVHDLFLNGSFAEPRCSETEQTDTEAAHQMNGRHDYLNTESTLLITVIDGLGHFVSLPAAYKHTHTHTPLFNAIFPWTRTREWNLLKMNTRTKDIKLDPSYSWTKTNQWPWRRDALHWRGRSHSWLRPFVKLLTHAGRLGFLPFALPLPPTTSIAREANGRSNQVKWGAACCCCLWCLTVCSDTCNVVNALLLLLPLPLLLYHTHSLFQKCGT